MIVYKPKEVVAKPQTYISTMRNIQIMQYSSENHQLSVDYAKKPSIMLSIRSFVLLAASLSCFVCTPASAFSVVLPTHVHPEDSTTCLHLFGNAFKDAFSNDDSLGKKENAGLKGGPKINEVTINGKPVKAVANQKVSQVLAAARTKVTYSCKKGDCGTCEIQMDGRIVKACQAKIPKGKCTINTF